MISVWPSLIYLVLIFTSIGISTGKDDLSMSHIVANTVVFGLLYWGGFFDPLLRLAS
jgi:hypothetical protein